MARASFGQPIMPTPQMTEILRVAIMLPLLRADGRTERCTYSYSSRGFCPDFRFFARLKGLPHAAFAEFIGANPDMSHDELVEFAAAATPVHTLNTATREAANKFLCTHCPVPSWAIFGVLLSPDLLPKLFATLAYDNCAAAAVCKSWRRCWLETDHQRRGLRPAPPLHYTPWRSPDGHTPLLGTIIQMTTHPDGRWMCFLTTGITVLFVGADLGEIDRFNTSRMGPGMFARDVCVSSDYLVVIQSGIAEDSYVCTYDISGFPPRLHASLEADAGSETEAGTEYHRAAFASNGMLLAIFEDRETETCTVVALDPDTLVADPTAFGGRPIPTTQFDLAVCGEEVIVAVPNANGWPGHRWHPTSFNVFSLDGTLLRQLRGAWSAGGPTRLLPWNGRLYCFKDGNYDLSEQEDAELSKRIHVLTPHGKIIQVWQAPGDGFVGSVCPLAAGLGREPDKLLVHMSMPADEDPEIGVQWQMVALKGI